MQQTRLPEITTLEEPSPSLAMGTAMSTGKGAAVQATAGAWAGTIFYAVSLFAAGMLIASILPPPTLLAPPPLHRLILHCRELLDRLRDPALHLHGSGQVQLAREAPAPRPTTPSPSGSTTTRYRSSSGPSRSTSCANATVRCAPSTLPSSLTSPATSCRRRKRAEINLDYYRRCIFPCPFRLSQATADLSVALAISPNNACARMLLDKCLKKKGGYKKKDMVGRRRRRRFLWN